MFGIARGSFAEDLNCLRRKKNAQYNVLVKWSCSEVSDSAQSLARSVNLGKLRTLYTSIFVSGKWEQ